MITASEDELEQKRIIYALLAGVLISLRFILLKEWLQVLVGNVDLWAKSLFKVCCVIDIIHVYNIYGCEG